MLKIFFLALTLIITIPVSAHAQQTTFIDQTEKTLNITLEQFIKNFNTHAKAIGAAQIQETDYKKQSNNFIALLGEDLTVVVKIQNKRIVYVAVLLSILTNNSIKLAVQAEVLEDAAVMVMKALDSNKVNDQRDKAVKKIYSDLLTDPKSIKMENIKTGIYGHYQITASFLPDMPLVAVSFESI